MTIRVLGILIGLAIMYFLPLKYLEVSDMFGLFEFIGSFVAAVSFIAYGIGGQKLLRKIAPFWAQQDDV